MNEVPDNLIGSFFACQCGKGRATVVESNAVHTGGKGPTGQVTFRCGQCGMGNVARFSRGVWVHPWVWAPLQSPAASPSSETVAAVVEASAALGDRDVYNVRVPEGGFLAVVFPGHVSKDAVERLQSLFQSRGLTTPVFVFGEGAKLVGVGPEGKANV